MCMHMYVFTYGMLVTDSDLPLLPQGVRSCREIIMADVCINTWNVFTFQGIICSVVWRKSKSVVMCVYPDADCAAEHPLLSLCLDYVTPENAD